MRILLAFSFLFLMLWTEFPSAAQSESRPGKALIQRLITIAEEGRLTDSLFVGSMLGVSFTERHEKQEPFARFCAPGYEKRPTNVTYYAAEPGLASTKFGVPSITVNGGLWGHQETRPYEIKGPVNINYYVSESNDCSGYVQLRQEIRSDLSISPLSVYDCLTIDNLLSWFPNIKKSIPNAHAEVYYYYESNKSRSNDAELTFQTQAGTSCIIGVRLSKDPSTSSQYVAAKRQQYICMLSHQEKFCKRNPPFTWRDVVKQDEMRAYSVKKCGTLDTFLAKTPKNATIVNIKEPSAEEYDSRLSTPCSIIVATNQANRRPKK